MDRIKWKIGLPFTDLKKLGLLLFLSLFYILTPLQAKAGTWTSVGPDGGDVRAIAISPNYATDPTIFAGTYGGGVFKSTNGGGSWSAVNTGLSNLYVYSLSISPNYASDQTIFAGTIENGGVYKSTNGGGSWDAVNAGLGSLNVYSLSISPNYASDQTIFAGISNSGVYKSMNGGGSWNAINTGLNNLYVLSLSISPNYVSDQTLFAGTNDGGVYKSTNSGGSWSEVKTALGDPYDVFSLSISPNYASDQTIFAGISNSGVYKSMNGGGSWGAVSTGWYVLSLAMSPNYASDQTIFAGTYGGVYKSTNGGGSWSAVNTGLSSPLYPLYVNSLSMSPNYVSDQTIFTGTVYGGVFKSTNGGGSWSAVNTGLSNLIVLSLSISPNYATDQTLFSGTWIGGVFKSTNGGGSWSAVNTGLSSPTSYALSISPNYATDQTIFAGTLSGVYKSTNGGGSWSFLNTGLGYLSVISLSISPNYATDQTIFAGTYSSGVYKSTTGGGSWSAINTGLNNLYVLSLSISPNYVSDQTLFTGTAGGVFKSTDGGGSWSAINTGLSDLTVSSLSISPNYATDQTIFAGTAGGVFKSTNGGGSWSAVNTGLSNLIVLSLSISPNYATDQTLFSGTWIGGVFKSTNGGGSWSAVNTSLSNLNVYSLSISPDYPSDGILFAGTERSSVWKYAETVCSPSPEVCNGIDDDCDSLIDEGVENTYYGDADSDTYGNALAITQACSQPSGYVSNNTDCNDTNSSINPAAAETCNGVDDNCNTQIDEGVQNTYYQDTDNDTYGNASGTTQACTVPSGYVSDNTDCNDNDVSINPAAAEVCNGIDDNCNAQVDEGVQSTYYRDADSDTYGNASVTTQACSLPLGYVANSADCNDINASINPGAVEVCNGVDDNCNTQIDESVQNTYYQDADNDTYGNIAVGTQECTQPSGYVTDNTDCNDSSASVYPGALEVCNGVDDNCNTQIDENVTYPYYVDADGDGYGDPANGTLACSQPTGYVQNNTDCDDTNPAINPGAVEIPNDGIDQDCNGVDLTTTSKLGNISTRGMVQTGDSVMIGGFIISGTAPRSVLIRGFGPTLADFGVTGAMANPYIELYSGQTLIATNDDWQTPIAQCDAPAVSCGTPQDIQSTGKDACSVATTGCSQDAAILVTLPPGAYTAIMRGVGGGTGVGLVGVDDNDTSTLSRLVNISTRGPVLTGDSVMIGGFIVGGSSSKTVLIRGFGPTLTDFGVTGALANPYIELYSGQTMIATNDNWQTPTAQCDAPAVSCGTPQEIQATGKDACSVATTGCSQDAAILVTLPPGAYTAIMRGVSSGTGVGLVGIDEIGP